MLFKHSVTSSIARTLICIVILTVLSTGLALITLVSSLNDAEAVNISGSLRMQSYRLAYDIVNQNQNIEQHLQQYTSSLNAPALAQLGSAYVPDNIQDKYNALLIRWRELDNQIRSGDRQVYLQEVAGYVAQIDDFVLAIQRYSEQKLWGAGVISIVSFIATLCLVFFAILFTRRQIVAPLNKMVQVSQLIQKGNFSLPPLDISLPNELGVLSSALTSMSSELAKLYRSLEDKVTEKTQMLTHANRTLNILYDCSQAMSVSQIERASFEQVLAIIRQRESLNVIQLMIFDGGEGRWVIKDGAINEQLSWYSSPLSLDGQTLGQLRWQCDEDQQPHPQLIQSVANMISRGIYFNRAQKQHLQLLLMEERGTIARELHDSLAQSLSFLLIQLTLLKRALPHDNQQAMAIISDFDQALAGAYRQLRELLATFRLSIQEADLHEALNQLIQPLQSQTTAQIKLQCELSSQSLNAQQQVHALQIVREALVNAIKHASANNIIVYCGYAANGDNMFAITDDGIGISTVEEPEGHYGLNIMGERAERLSGTLKIAKSDSGGTEVCLTFPPE